MASREDDFASRMSGDVTLMAVLTGGVHKASEIGGDGITRDATPGAFDSDGYLRPTALVRERSLVPDGNVRDGLAQVASAIQVVEIWLYADTTSATMEAAVNRLYVLFEGYAFADSFPVELSNILKGLRDEGALSGAALTRMDWAVYSVMGT